MQSTVKERILEFIKFKNTSFRAFESTCKLSNGYLRQLRNAPSIEKMEMILCAFPELNRTWLMTGEGEMMKETVNITTDDVSGNGNLIGVPVSQNIGEVSGQNAVSEFTGEAWLNELAKQRELTEKAQAIAETAQTQLSTALARISDLTDKLLQYLQNP